MHEIYTKEYCYAIALKYQKYKDFRTQAYSIYIKSFNNGWLRDYTWLVKEEPTLKWTEQSVYEEAKQYKTLKDFRLSVGKAYRKAKENGWLKLYTWLTKHEYNKTDPIWSVYVYKINNTYIYVGLTIDLNRRDYEHRTKYSKDTIAKFCYDNNISLPKNSYTVIKSSLTAKQAQTLENTLLDEYRKNRSFIVLNKGSTGENSSSLGNCVQKWTEESCYNAAKQCKTRKEFKSKYSRAYYCSIKNKWIEKYDWFINGRTKQVIQYTLHGDFIRLFENGADEVQRTLGINKRYVVNSANLNNTRNKTAKGFIWRYKDDVLDKDGNIIQKI